MENSLKMRTFKATIEPILLYGSECWIIYFTMRKQVDGYYTRLLKMATLISWLIKVTNTKLYRGIQIFGSDTKKKIAIRRSLHKAR